MKGGIGGGIIKGSIGDQIMNQPCPNKLEPSELNHEARNRLMDEISKRMNAINHTILNKTKYALDKCEFARNHSLDMPMDRTIQFLKEGKKELMKTLADHNGDIDALERLIDTAQKIQKGEEDEKGA